MKETIEEKVARLNNESTELKQYNKNYPAFFESEKEFLLSVLPDGIIKRIEHFGSTAIPNISSKPIVDILVEVSSLEEVKNYIVPILEKEGYDYLWRPSNNMQPPWYAWFIKRNGSGDRTHHIHMIEKDFKMWDRLLFKNYLCEFPSKAEEYNTLKQELAAKFPSDRAAYTNGKTELVLRLTEEAKKEYKL